MRGQFEIRSSWENQKKLEIYKLLDAASKNKDFTSRGTNLATVLCKIITLIDGYYEIVREFEDDMILLGVKLEYSSESHELINVDGTIAGIVSDQEHMFVYKDAIDYKTFDIEKLKRILKYTWIEEQHG